jgi:hypothetical protein
VEWCGITSTKVRMFYFSTMAAGVIDIQMGRGIGIRLV